MKKAILVLSFAFLLSCCVACGEPEQVSNEPFSVSICGQPYSGFFTGTMEANLPNGYGTFTYTDGNISISYSGLWAGGLVASEGTLDYDGFYLTYNGTDYVGHYTGNASNGWPKGSGRFTSDDSYPRLEYTGEWLNDRFTGIGELLFEDMSLQFHDCTYIGTYSGDVLDGSPEGFGSFTMPEDEVYLCYTGTWENGSITGIGNIECSNYTVIFSDSTTRVGLYEGEVLDGSASGSGIFTTKNDLGITYSHEGNWLNELPNGYGLRKWEDDDYVPLQGIFSNGDFMPTPLEFFIYAGSYKDQKYSINETAASFIDENSNTFLYNDTSSYYGDLDYEFQYDVFSKNHSQFGNTLIVVSDLLVIQISEENYYGADHTFCILEDYDGQVYYVNLYGFSEGIYEGDYVTLTALPLDYFTYPNVEGTAIWAIACAGVMLE